MDFLIKKSAVTGAFVLLCVALLVAVLGDIPLLNNGDYRRVTGDVVNAQDLSSGSLCPAFQRGSEPVNARSTMSMVFAGAYHLMHLLSASCLHAKTTAVGLLSVFLVGVATALAWGVHRGLVLLVISLAVLFSPFLTSNYEEAVVLPLVALCIAGHARMRTHGQWYLFVLPAALLIYAKAQMMLFAPLLAYLFVSGCSAGARKHLRTTVGLFILLLACKAIWSAKSDDRLANSYNRMYNGLGWSQMDAGSWPARHFFERYKFVRANLNVLQTKAHLRGPLDGLNLMGTSYWPTGNDLLGDAAKQPEIQKVVRYAIKPNNYFRTLLTPDVLPHFLSSVALLTVSSDYSLQYLRADAKVSGYMHTLTWMRDILLGHFGFVYLLFVMACVFLLQGKPNKFIGLGFLLAAPVAVAVGDGFYEYEKHLVTVFMAMPLVLLLNERGPSKETSVIRH